MEVYLLLFAIFSGIAILLVFVLGLKIHPFIGLLIASITVGVLAGLPLSQILVHLQKGMGNTLGFVALVVGLGAMFGSLLEHSGGAMALAQYLIKKTGEKNAPWAIALTGMLTCIPVFFDVAFIILFPMIVALQKNSGKSLLFYGIPLLAGLLISHAFIPPSPASIATTNIIGANPGLVILTGLIVALPGGILGGPIFGKYISERIPSTSIYTIEPQPTLQLPPISLIFILIGTPISLIVLNTFVNSSLATSLHIPSKVKPWVQFIGHPFTALLIANLLAWYFLGIRRNYTKDQLLKITGGSLAPAGSIILIIGAGGMFKQVLTETGAGNLLAEVLFSSGASHILFGFTVAAFLRIIQGSTTVAMITAGGITASVATNHPLTEIEKALIVNAISCGGSILSHVNDSGFWIVSRYFGLNEKKTLASWTVMTTIVAVVGILMVLLLEAILV